MKLTGTNRPITYTTHHPANPFKRGSHPGVVKRNKTACVHYVVPKQQTRHTTARCPREQNHNKINNTTVVTPQISPPPGPHRPARYGSKGYGGHSVGETPGPIPNPEAKTHSADGTAPGRVWESRSPPEHHYTVESPNHTVGALPHLTAIPFLKDRRPGRAARRRRAPA